MAAINCMAEVTGRALLAKDLLAITPLPDMDLSVVLERVRCERHLFSKRSRQRLAKAEREYRKLWQKFKVANQFDYDDVEAMLRPSSSDVDDIWHAHILHTRKYAEDCGSYFGYFLHHTPTQAVAGTECRNS